MKRIALIIAGGSGERFWPLSSKNRPKQLLRITDSGLVMLEETVNRVEEIFGIENVFIITSESLIEPIREVIPELGAHLIAEPEKRNTAGAVVWGMGVVAGLLDDTDLTFAVFPSDHLIRPKEEFHRTILEGLDFAEREGKLVTVGMQPTRPETGYGYIERGKAAKGKCHEVAKFIEKPNLETAEKLLKSNKVFWNTGIFFWTLQTFLQELSTASPVHEGAFREIMGAVKQGRTVVAEIAFRELPNISVDHGVLEKSPNVGVVEANYEWDDIGAWDALERILGSDGNGNSIHGQAFALDSTGCVIHNTNPDQMIKLLGVKDLVVVATPNAILVCPKDQAQEVKRLASEAGIG
jgi:mannose-1-phosphate guanylyltransferase